MMDHWFWWLLTMACVAWYLTVTLYVAVKGSVDVKEMLTRLGDGLEEPSHEGQQSPQGTERR